MALEDPDLEPVWKDIAEIWPKLSPRERVEKGMNDDSLDRMGEITGELLMIWGRQDPHVPGEGRARIYSAMTGAGLNFTWHEFNEQHAFLRDEGPRYDPALALTCCGLALELFQRKLGEGDRPAGAAAWAGESRH